MNSEKEENGVEYHKVQTEDGYILTLMRVNRTLNNNSTPVLLVHGALACGPMWLLGQPDKTLPNRLASEGYDVWVANLRGSKLSKAHISMENTSAKFWDFSWHEMGYYDLPAILDMILDTTGRKSIFYIGHSMGCSAFIVMMSTKPEYNSKVKAMVALAPAVFAKNVRNKPLRRIIAPIASVLGKVRMFRRSEVCRKPSYDMIDSVYLPGKHPGRMACYIGQKACRFVGATSKNQMEKNIMISFMNNGPASTSAKTMCHGFQCMSTEKFRHFNYGRSENFKRYGTVSPPIYDIHKVTVPVATFHSEYDEICTTKDVTQLSEDLPNSIGNYGICHPKFAHADFMLGKDADRLVYQPIVQIFQDFETGGTIEFNTKGQLGKDTTISVL